MFTFYNLFGICELFEVRVKFPLEQFVMLQVIAVRKHVKMAKTHSTEQKHILCIIVKGKICPLAPQLLSVANVCTLYTDSRQTFTIESVQGPALRVF